MAKTREQVEREAIGWVIRLRAAPAEDWEAFTSWLEADPAQAAAYEEAALADAALEALPKRKALPILPHEGQAQPRRMPRRTFLGWGLAAALVGVIGYASLRPGDASYAIATGAGERRGVELADGSRIHLNGSTRLILDRERPRFASIEQGEALFTIVHDDARPFQVEAGDAMLQDMGTVFNVVRDPGGALEVAVAEGGVVYNPGREAVDLGPGMALRKEAGRPPIVEPRDAEAITGWREGRLSYSNAPVGRIAADISRNIGLPVTASPDVAARRFSGVIMLDRDPDRLFERVSALLDVGARRSREGWILTMRSGDTP